MDTMGDGEPVVDDIPPVRDLGHSSHPDNNSTSGLGCQAAGRFSQRQFQCLFAGKLKRLSHGQYLSVHETYRATILSSSSRPTFYGVFLPRSTGGFCWGQLP